MNVGTPVFYADKECTKPLDIIKWDQNIKIRLVDGKEEILPNSAMAGQIMTATVYIRNEEKYRFAVTKVYSAIDKRIKIRIDKAWLIPNIPVRVFIEFNIPKKPESKDLLKMQQIVIEGYYIIDR